VATVYFPVYVRVKNEPRKSNSRLTLLPVLRSHFAENSRHDENTRNSCRASSQEPSPPPSTTSIPRRSFAIRPCRVLPETVTRIIRPSSAMFPRSCIAKNSEKYSLVVRQSSRTKHASGAFAKLRIDRTGRRRIDIGLNIGYGASYNFISLRV